MTTQATTSSASPQATSPALDPERVQAFAAQVFGDLGAAVSGALVHLGDRLGLFKGLAHGPATPAQLAARTGTAERYVREWLGNQAASGYVRYDAALGTYSLPAEHAAVLADERSHFFLAGGFETTVATYRIVDRLEHAFRTGEGVGWHEHDHRLFCGCERFFAPAYRKHLVADWIPSLPGLVEKMRAGARVADVGCGHGMSTILMAQAFPRSQFTGFDSHEASVRTARQRAQEAGVGAVVTFECAPAAAFPGRGYDLITFFDCLHDMGDPTAAAAHARQALAPGGRLMLIEPMAGDRAEHNHNPVGRAYYGFSTLVCTPASLAQPGRAALGAQAGEARLREVLARAGFTTVRRAMATPFNLILEAHA
jgi:SAM-dependent methyltransferase